MSFAIEPRKRIQIIYDVDVIVAGGGISGVFAAIAAARYGAETVLIDRFGSPGGNMGPGMISAGSFNPYLIHPKTKRVIRSVLRGITGIPKEFIERYAAFGGGAVPPYRRIHQLRDSNIAYYVALKMLEEADVRLLLSTYVADPIMEGNRVCGVFVENKSGRQALRAKVTIDATGEADVARRAGAPILLPKASYHEVDGHAPTGMGLYFALGGVDWEKYEKYKEEHDRVADGDLSWAKDVLKERYIRYPRALFSPIRKAWESGEYRIVQEIDGLGEVGSGELWQGIGERGMVDRSIGERGMASRQLIVRGVDAGNGMHISKLEAKVRMYIFETAQFWKRYVTGFENSYLLCVAPFFGTRGGPCIEGEYTLTMDDCEAGRRFPDVIYMYGEWRALLHTVAQGEPKWVDVPYGVMVPKKIDGLLAVGRSASGIPDTLLRGRTAVMHMGQAGGTAAALAARNTVTPRELDVKMLQETLLDAGFHLGDRSRLKELGLAPGI